eukprot:TRINITY_DN8765_c0_g1_i2.p4 TRINITY_DN8765_c0_g1~~TRINITY_DN8765_c0_g1_i2.p4  ORF type:complete len:121 (+),score=30.70 TRINITY_DN8765_c0_g1_i2:27-365(+)
MTQTVDRVVEVPMTGQTIQGGQRVENIPVAPVRQRAPDEVHQVHEVGMPLPAEQGAAVHKGSLPPQHGGVLPMIAAHALAPAPAEAEAQVAATDPVPTSYGSAAGVPVAGTQ